MATSPSGSLAAAATPSAGLAAPLAPVVGGKAAKALETGLGLRTVEELLRHYPRRYAQRGELTDLRALRVDEHVTVVAEVSGVTRRRMRNRPGSILEVTVTDGRGKLRLTFFNRAAWHERELTVGRRGLFAGKVSAFKGSHQLAHPDYVVLGAEAGTDEASAFADQLIPVYPATAHLQTWTIARCVRMALDTLGDVEDPLPAPMRTRHDVPDLRQAFELLHRPSSREDVARATRRLRFEEAFVLQLALARRRAEQRALPATPRTPRAGGILAAFDARLPFDLTAGQRTIGGDITRELASDHPMHRLLQGEVASGKTVVALRAMLSVVDAGGQAALLAPTEVLAQQHHRSITEMLGPLAERGLLGGSENGTRVALLTGSQPPSARRRALLDAASGNAGIVVGTHALIQDSVEFLDLGLVVVDEQHRFGVEQRDALRAKAARPPHLLVMTATPIPRTVAMTVFGDLDVSTLAELPRGRSAIVTHVVPAGERPRFLERAWERVCEEVAAGRQAYIVCPRIGGPDAPAAGEEAGGEEAGGEEPEGAVAGSDSASGGRRPPLAVLDVAPLLRDGPLHGLRVEQLHGRMAPEAKDDVMRRFAGSPASTRGVDVLVATTVVEVGLDVPNATVMVILDADRFGVSQLHQLRGRVGRGGAPGLCLLVTEAPGGTAARQRLDAVAGSVDGFELSRIDLEQRREGDVLGASQSGRRSSLRMLAVLRDEELITLAREEAAGLVRADPQLREHPALRAALDVLLDEERADYLEKG